MSADDGARVAYAAAQLLRDKGWDAAVAVGEGSFSIVTRVGTRVFIMSIPPGLDADDLAAAIDARLGSLN